MILKLSISQINHKYIIKLIPKHNKPKFSTIVRKSMRNKFLLKFLPFFIRLGWRPITIKKTFHKIFYSSFGNNFNIFVVAIFQSFRGVTFPYLSYSVYLGNVIELTLFM